jgi:diguanylate cyclase (GGDEF)-like protein
MTNVNVRELNPEKAHEALTRATILWSSGNFTGALGSIRECLRYQPNNTDAYTLLARIYISARKFDVAYTMIQKVIENGSPSEEILLLKAKTELMTKHFDDCRGTLEDVFAFKRDHPKGLLIMADLKVMTGKYSDAISLYERLHKLEPGSREILYGLAESFFRLKDYDETIYYCKQIMDSDSGSVKGIEHLYTRALRELKRRVIEERGNMSLVQKIYMYFKDPITDDQIRIKSIQDRSQKRTEREKYRDGLTDGLNVKALNDYVPAILYKAEAEVWLGLCDIDFFKAFNDHYSYVVGDIVLKVFNKIGAAQFPDKFFRIGGEEFCWVFIGTEEEAFAIAKDFREKVENFATKDANEYIKEKRVLNPVGGNLFVIGRGISISQGLAKYKTDGNTLEELLATSNVSLKKCKDQYGRNCVVYQDKLIDQGVKPDVPKFVGR